MSMIEVSEPEQMILYGLRSLIAENNDEQLKILEDTYFAKSKQTIFTKAELADKWGCSVGHVTAILEASNLKPIGKRGKNHEFNIEQAQEAKKAFDGEQLYKHELNWKMRMM